VLSRWWLHNRRYRCMEHARSSTSQAVPPCFNLPNSQPAHSGLSRRVPFLQPPARLVWPVGSCCCLKLCCMCCCMCVYIRCMACSSIDDGLSMPNTFAPATTWHNKLLNKLATIHTNKAQEHSLPPLALIAAF